MVYFRTSSKVFLIIMGILAVILIIALILGIDSLSMPIAILLFINVVWNLISWLKDTASRKRLNNKFNQKD